MKNPNRRFSIATLIACLLATSTSLAEEDPNRGEDWAPVKRLEFTAEDIEGGIMAPDGTRIESVVRAVHPSLIELRQGFEAEIVKMLEDI